ncbi:MAG: orotidine-5'-phosphate decarboxylase, partial [Chloroflexi bacterium]|nr:orotidine-5'-phosphate decarboxylase [Chloroflexota bacterium]
GFYLAEGAAGLVALERIVRLVPPDIPIILDGKFGDIGNTAQAYARGAFEQFKADAVTLSPYMGSDSVKPFLAYPDHGVFVLARTSNPHAGELQNLKVIHEAAQPSTDQDMRSPADSTMYERVALMASQWYADGPGACGLVVGATAPQELQRIRDIVPELPFLIPGVGTQGGDVAAAVRYGTTRSGIGPVVNASRSIIYASSGANFAADARAVALGLVEQMRREGERGS